MNLVTIATHQSGSANGAGVIADICAPEGVLPMCSNMDKPGARGHPKNVDGVVLDLFRRLLIPPVLDCAQNTHNDDEVTLNKRAAFTPENTNCSSNDEQSPSKIQPHNKRTYSAKKLKLHLLIVITWREILATALLASVLAGIYFCR